MRKRMIALLTAGVLFSLMVGVGCGKVAVENIAVRKTTSSETEEEGVKGGEEGTPEGEKDGKEGSREETEVPRKESAKEAGETERQKALREELGVPEQFSAEYTDEWGVTQVIDAKVTVPDADTFLIYPAEEKIFRDEDIRTILKPILGEGGLYRFEPEDYEHLVSRAAGLKRRLENKDYQGEEERQSLEETLDTTEKCIQDMQGEVRKTAVPLRMTQEEKLDSEQFFDCLTGFTDWEQRTAEVLVSKYGLVFWAWPESEQGGCTISAEQAETLAKEYMRKMGLSEELTLDYSGMREPDDRSGEQEGHVFAYVRSVGGVPIGYWGAGGLYFVIDDLGVRWIEYSDYVAGQGGEPVELLPFSQIRKIYEETPIRISCEPGELKAAAVDEIRLVYRWVPDSGEGAAGYLVPVWEAFGTYESTDENGVLHNSDPTMRECLLAVNAVDGTILDN